MSEELYERYKDALRRGHVAAVRGRLDVAEAAYHEAAGIAPDRPLPHVGLGNVLARLGRTDDALAAYAAALDRAPADEAAMRGRADVLAAAGRRAEAADSLDRLAAILERDGRLADAADVARRAVELAESRGRRRDLQSLVARLRSQTGDTAAAEALARALGVLETVPGAAIVEAVAAGDGADGSGPAEATIDLPPPPPPDPSVLTLAVEAALEAGELADARRLALVAAAAHRAVGQYHAAMDLCYQALAIAPSDPDIHLALAELYLDRGWRGPAADKLVLLGRLSMLTNDETTRTRLCALAAARFPDEPRLAAVCA
jgi:tetratricopeptide (TPR) repeat protein